MNPHLTYLLLDLASLAGPLALSFDRRVAFYRRWRALFPPLLLMAAGFIVWDVVFTQHGVWSFNEAYLTGVWLGNLPLEEWLFFLVVPYACVFVYACLEAYIRPLRTYGKGWGALPVIGLALIAWSALSYQQAYTFWAPGLCGWACLLLYLLRNRLREVFRPQLFLLSWLVCLIPFLLVNGVLTRLPVVLYNDAENCGVRIGTIPFEDVFYGMLLVLGSVVGMEWLMRRRTAKGER